MADHNGHREPATPEEIWNILREVAESQKETDRRLQETGQLLRQHGQETGRRFRETDLRLRRLERISGHYEATVSHRETGTFECDRPGS